MAARATRSLSLHLLVPPPRSHPHLPPLARRRRRRRPRRRRRRRLRRRRRRSRSRRSRRRRSTDTPPRAETARRAPETDIIAPDSHDSRKSGSTLFITSWKEIVNTFVRDDDNAHGKSALGQVNTVRQILRRCQEDRLGSEENEQVAGRKTEVEQNDGTRTSASVLIQIQTL
ncbi:hypothetical protein V1478_007137 [Vespula squamosa]|uniref:Uncharacterized protein n=1 Tax=Vespula squamosa TaxID=30214 RepID=A0ABD2B2A7_VESSQ